MEDNEKTKIIVNNKGSISLYYRTLLSCGWWTSGKFFHIVGSQFRIFIKKGFGAIVKHINTSRHLSEPYIMIIIYFNFTMFFS